MLSRRVQGLRALVLAGCAAAQGNQHRGAARLTVCTRPRARQVSPHRQQVVALCAFLAKRQSADHERVSFCARARASAVLTMLAADADRLRASGSRVAREPLIVDGFLG